MFVISSLLFTFYHCIFTTSVTLLLSLIMWCYVSPCCLLSWVHPKSCGLLILGIQLSTFGACVVIFRQTMNSCPHFVKWLMICESTTDNYIKKSRTLLFGPWKAYLNLNLKFQWRGILMLQHASNKILWTIPEEYAPCLGLHIPLAM